MDEQMGQMNKERYIEGQSACEVARRLILIEDLSIAGKLHWLKVTTPF